MAVPCRSNRNGAQHILCDRPGWEGATQNRAAEKSCSRADGRHQSRNGSECTPMSDLNRIGAAVGVMAMLLFGSRGWADNPPGGSYKQTCQNIVAAGDTLRADCKDNGGTVHASPPLQAYSHCAGDISNQNSVLSCVPNGSYAATCIELKLSGTTLAANCLPLIGTRLASTLPNINTCMSDILNFNGRL